VIVVCGALDDSPVARVLEAVAARRAEVVHVDAALAAAMRHDLELGGDPRGPACRGWLELDGRRVPAEAVRGIYLRLPAPAPPARSALLELAAAGDLVAVNRPGAGRAHAARPYQLGLARAAGFDVPATLVTSDVAAARAFLRVHRTVIYKSISGTRSVVAVLGDAEVARLDDLGAGPIQLQAFVAGLDVRVHVVGDRWFACAVRPGGELEACELPAEVGARAVGLARAHGLALAGLDLRRTDADRWCCFEVDPSPGFSRYEEATGHLIAAAIARLLLSEAGSGSGYRPGAGG
jgi:glutathione synthase/RimK-type ligase-like ATP-grasp enzyme